MAMAMAVVDDDFFLHFRSSLLYLTIVIYHDDDDKKRREKNDDRNGLYVCKSTPNNHYVRHKAGKLAGWQAHRKISCPISYASEKVCILAWNFHSHFRFEHICWKVLTHAITNAQLCYLIGSVLANEFSRAFANQWMKLKKTKNSYWQTQIDTFGANRMLQNRLKMQLM